MNIRPPINSALEIVGTDRLNRVVEVQNHHLPLLRSHPCSTRSEDAKQKQQNRPQQDYGSMTGVPFVVCHCSHGIVCPRRSSASFIPFALALAGSTLSAPPTPPAAALSSFACRSSLAKTRYAGTLGASSIDAFASCRAASASPLRSRTAASPAWASADCASAARASRYSRSASSTSPRWKN